MSSTVYSPLQAEGLQSYKIVNEIGKGTYGCVYEAIDLRYGNLVAMKKVLPKVEREGFPITAIREIKTLKSLHHYNVLELLDVLYERPRRPADRGSVYMVFPFIKHDLVGIQHYRRNRLHLPEVKCITMQVLSGLEYLHGQGIIHRDLKLANLLIDGDGAIKIADFGLARANLPHAPDQTNKVVTRWYRPPELLLGATKYDSSVDMWSVGAIFAELVIGTPLFPGETEMHVLRYIFDTIGPPNEKIWPGYTRLHDCANMMVDVNQARRVLDEFIARPLGVCRYDSRMERPTDLLVTDANSNYTNRKVFTKLFTTLSENGQNLVANMLQYDPARRITASQALKDPFFYEDPPPCEATAIALSPDSRRELQVKDGAAPGPVVPMRESKRQLTRISPSTLLLTETSKRRRKA